MKGKVVIRFLLGGILAVLSGLTLVPKAYRYKGEQCPEAIVQCDASGKCGFGRGRNKRDWRWDHSD